MEEPVWTLPEMITRPQVTAMALLALSEPDSLMAFIQLMSPELLKDVMWMFWLLFAQFTVESTPLAGVRQERKFSLNVPVT